MINPDIRYKEVLKDINKYIKKDENIKLIDKAYHYAKEKHEGQFRKSGEPYIIHPLEVVDILASINAGPATLAAGFLHDVVEDTETTLDDLRKEFNEEVASLVDGLTKIMNLDLGTNERTQKETQQKMLFAMAKDIRVILIKLADRLHNMRTLDIIPLEKQIKISNETLDIYAPISHKLGMYLIKTELEDTALKYVDPYSYHLISNYINNKKTLRSSLIDEMIKSITNFIKDYNFSNFIIKGRVKGIYSIYKKMKKNNSLLEDIYDIFAIRIIVEKVEECYQILGIIHSHYVPLPKRFKDYIAVPKPNMYQSLHTTVLGEDGEIFEIQIRTTEMDKVAEYGVAAHWAYKENKEYSKEKEQFEIASKLKWYGELLKMTSENETETPEEFVDSIKEDILDTTVYVFTPTKEVIDLPKGSTPLDFAYKIHTNIGHKTVGAIVNNKIVPLNYELKNGDIVSIKTNKQSFGPSEDWLKIVKTSTARNKIKNFLNKQNKESLTLQGKEELEKELIKNRIENNEITLNFIKNNFNKSNFQSIDDFYFEIGKNLLSPKTVISKIKGVINPKDDILKKQIEKNQRILTSHSETGVIIEGLSNPQIRLGNCCNPIPGDDIIGFVSKGFGIVVHRKECKNIKNVDNNRLLTAYWGANLTRKYVVKITITTAHRNNVLIELVTIINAKGISIAQVNAKNKNKLEDVIKFNLLVNNYEQLESLISNLRKTKDVYNIEREIS